MIVINVLNSLIAGGAWLAVLKGLLTTFIISFFGLILGTLLGALFCAARMSPRKYLNIPAKMIISFMRGTPVLLLLMVLYFVVFSNVNIDALLVAVLAFGLNSGAHISEIIRAALVGVDKMQNEAARMLGASKLMAFVHITLPQAVVIAKPVYQNAIVSLIQWTSVVGYVAISDLTRAVNSLGSRTGDPFLALFLGMLFYLLLSYLVYGIFKLADRRSSKHE